MQLNNEFEIVRSCAWWVLRRIGSNVVLFKSLTRANTVDHYKHTYLAEEN